jgi:hypothetical protein
MGTDVRGMLRCLRASVPHVGDSVLRCLEALIIKQVIRSSPSYEDDCPVIIAEMTSFNAIDQAAQQKALSNKAIVRDPQLP